MYVGFGLFPDSPLRRSARLGGFFLARTSGHPPLKKFCAACCLGFLFGALGHVGLGSLDSVWINSRAPAASQKGAVSANLPGTGARADTHRGWCMARFHPQEPSGATALAERQNGWQAQQSAVGEGIEVGGKRMHWIGSHDGFTSLKNRELEARLMLPDAVPRVAER